METREGIQSANERIAIRNPSLPPEKRDEASQAWRERQAAQEEQSKEAAASMESETQKQNKDNGLHLGKDEFKMTQRGRSSTGGLRGRRGGTDTDRFVFSSPRLEPMMLVSSQAAMSAVGLESLDDAVLVMEEEGGRTHVDTCDADDCTVVCLRRCTPSCVSEETRD